MRTRTSYQPACPVTGQAGWYDVRVRIYPAEGAEEKVFPQFAAMHAYPGMRDSP